MGTSVADGGGVLDGQAQGLVPEVLPPGWATVSCERPGTSTDPVTAFDFALSRWRLTGRRNSSGARVVR